MKFRKMSVPSLPHPEFPEFLVEWKAPVISILINSSLTEREGRTGEYWHLVVIVRTEHREVRTKTAKGQYSPVRL